MWWAKDIFPWNNFSTMTNAMLSVLINDPFIPQLLGGSISWLAVALIGCNGPEYRWYNLSGYVYVRRSSSFGINSSPTSAKRLNLKSCHQFVLHSSLQVLSFCLEPNCFEFETLAFLGSAILVLFISEIYNFPFLNDIYANLMIMNCWFACLRYLSSFFSNFYLCRWGVLICGNL